MKLSQRLETVASFVPQGSRIADIGTDHGYIPIWLVKHGIAEHGIAMDVRKGPLLRAQEHIAGYRLTEKIETRLSDGLAALMPGEADTVIIAGMGGDLMLRILRDGTHVRADITNFVLSPQSELDLFRHGLEDLGLMIQKETMLCEDGKYYAVMLATKGQMHYEAEFRYRYGDYLIRQNSAVLKELLKKEEVQLIQIEQQLAKQDSDGARKRYAEVRADLEQIKEAYHAMQ